MLNLKLNSGEDSRTLGSGGLDLPGSVSEKKKTPQIIGKPNLNLSTEPDRVEQLQLNQVPTSSQQQSSQQYYNSSQQQQQTYQQQTQQNDSHSSTQINVLVQSKQLHLVPPPAAFHPFKWSEPYAESFLVDPYWAKRFYTETKRGKQLFSSYGKRGIVSIQTVLQYQLGIVGYNELAILDYVEVLVMRYRWEEERVQRVEENNINENQTPGHQSQESQDNDLNDDSEESDTRLSEEMPSHWIALSPRWPCIMSARCFVICEGFVFLFCFLFFTLYCVASGGPKTSYEDDDNVNQSFEEMYNSSHIQLDIGINVLRWIAQGLAFQFAYFTFSHYFIPKNMTMTGQANQRMLDRYNILMWGIYPWVFLFCPGEYGNYVWLVVLIGQLTLLDYYFKPVKPKTAESNHSSTKQTLSNSNMKNNHSLQSLRHSTNSDSILPVPAPVHVAQQGPVKTKSTNLSTNSNVQAQCQSAVSAPEPGEIIIRCLGESKISEIAITWYSKDLDHLITENSDSDSNLNDIKLKKQYKQIYENAIVNVWNCWTKCNDADDSSGALPIILLLLIHGLMVLFVIQNSGKDDTSGESSSFSTRQFLVNLILVIGIPLVDIGSQHMQSQAYQSQIKEIEKIQLNNIQNVTTGTNTSDGIQPGPQIAQLARRGSIRNSLISHITGEVPTGSISVSRNLGHQQQPGGRMPQSGILDNNDNLKTSNINNPDDDDDDDDCENLKDNARLLHRALASTHCLCHPFMEIVVVHFIAQAQVFVSFARFYTLIKEIIDNPKLSQKDESSILGNILQQRSWPYSLLLFLPSNLLTRLGGFEWIMRSLTSKGQYLDTIYEVWKYQKVWTNYPTFVLIFALIAARSITIFIRSLLSDHESEEVTLSTCLSSEMHILLVVFFLANLIEDGIVVSVYKRNWSKGEEEIKKIDSSDEISNNNLNLKLNLPKIKSGMSMKSSRSLAGDSSKTKSISNKNSSFSVNDQIEGPSKSNSDLNMNNQSQNPTVVKKLNTKATTQSLNCATLKTAKTHRSSNLNLAEQVTTTTEWTSYSPSEWLYCSTIHMMFLHGMLTWLMLAVITIALPDLGYRPKIWSDV